MRHIRAVDQPGIYALLDFHPYLENPVHVRLLKDIAEGRALGDTTTLADPGVVQRLMERYEEGDA